MANNLNDCKFIGHLGGDPEVKYTTNGVPVANFNIAVNKQWKDKASGERQDSVTWVRCVAFQRTAEIAGDYLKKGSHVCISAEYRSRQYQAQDGTDRWAHEFVVRSMEMLDKAGGDGGQSRANAQAGNYGRDSQHKPAPAGGSGPNEFDDDLDDDIPFISNKGHW